MRLSAADCWPTASHAWHLGVALLAFQLSGCATSQLVPSEDLVFHSIDDPASHGFFLHLENNTRRRVCVSPAIWPNASGYIGESSASISVKLGFKVYPLDTFIEDFGSDTFTIRAGAELSAFLNYDNFKLPLEVQNLPKALLLTPTAVFC